MRLFYFLGNRTERRHLPPEDMRMFPPTDSHIFLLVAAQPYHVTVPDDSVIVGNDVVIRCNIPSFVSDFLSVTAWVTSEGSEFQSRTQSGINYLYSILSRPTVGIDFHPPSFC